jgi:hypothetical protein
MEQFLTSYFYTWCCLWVYTCQTTQQSSNTCVYNLEEEESLFQSIQLNLGVLDAYLIHSCPLDAGMTTWLCLLR